MDDAIKTHRLTRYYGGRKVVNNLDLCIPQGCVYGLLGRNGAGKSTTLKMITGTDFIVTLPRRIQQLLASEVIFNHCEAPNGLPGFTLDMQWSQSADEDGANAWLREQVVQACTEQDMT